MYSSFSYPKKHLLIVDVEFCVGESGKIVYRYMFVV
jgi:hypothetical protein